MRLSATAIFMILMGCGSQGLTTTKSDLSRQEVLELQARASANDVKALRELELHYDFEDMDKMREEMHVKLLKLGDPEALVEEADKIAISAERTVDKKEKKRLLDKAISLAQRAAQIEGLKDTSQYAPVKIIQKDLDKLDSEK
jgi:hypothetical protein